MPFCWFCHEAAHLSCVKSSENRELSTVLVKSVIKFYVKLRENGVLYNELIKTYVSVYNTEDN